MINYQAIMKLYNRIHGRIWAVLFRANFKRFGKKSRIAYPLWVQNAKYIEIGENVNILKRTWLVAVKIDHKVPKLVIADGSRIGNYNTISSVRDVRIGKRVLIADRVYISDNLHGYEDVTLPVMEQPLRFKSSVSIGDGSWIGTNVSIIGAQVGRHCVIGANSVVTDDIPDYSVAVGAPARVVKQYNFKTSTWERVKGAKEASNGNLVNHVKQSYDRNG